jgi:transglutaminase-like putative cysteine protease
MKFKVSSQLDYEITAPLTFFLSIRAQNSAGQRVLKEQFIMPSRMPHEVQLCESTGTLFDRIHAEVPGLFTIRYEAEVEVFAERIPAGQLQAQGPEHFSMDVLPYLYPSRYCESDRLGMLTMETFGHLETPEEKVRAAVDWIATRISYVSGSTHSSTSAANSLVDRVGVCRDFAHLGIALCRAMNIPARYFTGYAFDIQPADFHACFETWIGGRWLFWDATRLASPDGVVRIAAGRDAADCSVCTAFGEMHLQRQIVECEIEDGSYQKMTPEQLAAEVVSLDPAEPPN